jgi:IS30 family transposase
MKMSYKRITYEQRLIIEKLVQLGYRNSRIAEEIGCHKSTISRDLRRISDGTYNAMEATHQAVSNASNRRFAKCKIIQHKPLGDFILNRLKRRWSPEQIHLYLKKHYSKNALMQISMESIYFYIYVHAKSELKKNLISQLRQKRRYRGNVRRGEDKRTTIQDPVRIDERPSEVLGREIPGHWEGDLILGKDRTSAIGTLNERTTRTVILVHLKKRDAESVRKAFEREFKSIPRQMKKTLTYDNGSEMAQHKLFTKNTKIQVFFTHPYSPWERPTNENSNGLIRDYFPKGTDFSKITRKELKRVQNELNERPRKVLDMCTPKEVFDQLVMEQISM